MKIKLNIKKFASHIAISFFFTAIFVLCFYFFLDEKISKYTSIINVAAVGSSNITREIKYDFELKKIIEYPSFGSKFANLIIPKIDLNLPIYQGDNLRILSYGVGHYVGSYFPAEGGSIILPAHNTAGFFQRIDELQKNDIIKIETTYGTFNYKVGNYKVVDEKDLDSFPVQKEKEMLILYTCYPINRSIIGRKTKRYVVYADKVGEQDE